MDIKQTIDIAFKKVFTNLKKDNQADQLLINNLVTETSNELVFTITSILNQKVSSPKAIENILNNINDLIFNQIFNLTYSVKEIIIFALSSPFLTIESLESLEEKYLQKINSLEITDQKFQVLYSNVFASYLYELTIASNLKNDIATYKTINEFINKTKIELYQSFVKIMTNKRQKAILLFDKEISKIIKEVNQISIKINNQNLTMLKDYATNLISTKNSILIKENLNNLHTSINEIIKANNKQLFKNKKSKNSIDCAYNELNEYLLSFANSLYDKLRNVFNNTLDLIYLDKKNITQELKNYEETVYRIFALDFNFDKPFLKYQNAIIKSKKLFISQKNLDEIKININDSKNEVIIAIKNSLNNAFKEETGYLNKTLFKYLTAKEKNLNKLNLLTEQELHEIFK